MKRTNTQNSNFFKFSGLPFPVIFLTALKLESAVLLEVTSHQKLKSLSGIKVFRLDNKSVYLMETGVSVPFTQSALADQIKILNPGLLIHFGTCGSLDANVPLHSIFLIQKVFSELGEPIKLAFPQNVHPRFSDEFQVQNLLTVKDPVLGDRKIYRQYIAEGYSLVDMEAWRLAKIAAELRLPLLILKIVSDYGEENALQKIKAHQDVIKINLRKELRKSIEILSGSTANRNF